MLKIIAGGAIAALMLVAAPGVGVAAQTNKAPAVQTNEHAKTEKATEYSAQRRRYYRHRYRYARPYYRPYGYAYRPYYARPYYSPYGYYGNPYYRRPGVYLGFGF
jgi:hypothetical protein